MMVTSCTLKKHKGKEIMYCSLSLPLHFKNQPLNKGAMPYKKITTAKRKDNRLGTDFGFKY